MGSGISYKNRTGISITYGGSDYIHFHQKNIGRMMSKYIDNEQGADSAELVRLFTTCKNNANKAIKTQYKELLSSSMIDSNSIDLLNEVFKDSRNITKLNKQLQEDLTKMLDTEKIKVMIQKQSNINWSDARLQQALNSGQGILQDIDNLMQTIEECTNLIGKEGALIGTIINSLRRKKKMTITNFGTNLLKELTKLENSSTFSNITTVSQQQAFNALGELKKLAARFKTGNQGGTLHDNETPITADFIQKYVDKHFFSTVMGESLAMGIKDSAITTCATTVKNDLEHIKPAGADQVKFMYTDPKGIYTSQTEMQRQGKADVKLQNVQVDLSYIFSQMSGKIEFTLGLSNKAYKNLSLNPNDLSIKDKVEGGSIPLSRVINLITTSANVRYLISNTLIWGAPNAESSAHNVQLEKKKDLSQALSVLQDALFTRSILYGFSARGQSDFANFILINGELFSVWELVNYASKNVMKPASARDSSQIMSFTITGFKTKFGVVTSYVDALTRTTSANKALTSSEIEVKLNPNRYLRNLT